MKNQDIRTEAQKMGVKLWQIAAKLNLSDCNFSRKLRKELKEDEKVIILSIINELNRGEK